MERWQHSLKPPFNREEMGKKSASDRPDSVAFGVGDPQERGRPISETESRMALSSRSWSWCVPPWHRPQQSGPLRKQALEERGEQSIVGRPPEVSLQHLSGMEWKDSTLQP
jgi:hypothetical protein